MCLVSSEQYLCLYTLGPTAAEKNTSHIHTASTHCSTPLYDVYTLNIQHYTIIYTTSIHCSTPLYTLLQRLNNCTHILLWNEMHCPWKPKKHVLWNRWIHIHSAKQALKRYRAAVQFKMWLAVSYLMALGIGVALLGGNGGFVNFLGVKEFSVRNL